MCKVLLLIKLITLLINFVIVSLAVKSSPFNFITYRKGLGIYSSEKQYFCQLIWKFAILTVDILWEEHVVRSHVQYFRAHIHVLTVTLFAVIKLNSLYFCELPDVLNVVSKAIFCKIYFNEEETGEFSMYRAIR